MDRNPFKDGDIVIFKSDLLEGRTHEVAKIVEDPKTGKLYMKFPLSTPLPLDRLDPTVIVKVSETMGILYGK